MNDAEQIQRAFAPHYDTSVAEPTDPNDLYDSWREVDRFGVVRPEDVEAFGRAYFVAPGDGAGVQAKLYALLDVARDRFTDLEEADQEEFRTWLKRRVHVAPSGHPVEANVTVADEHGQFAKDRHFYVRLNNGTRAIKDEKERERYIAQRWGRPRSV